MHPTSAPRLAGIGLRLPHLATVLRDRPKASWFEVHPENFIANPHAAELLVEIAALYPVSVHSVGISVGSAGGIDRAHLARIKMLIDRINPVMLSGHLAWSTHEGEYLNDLLPLPYDEESLRLLTDHISEVQDVLGRPYLVENPSSYIGYRLSTMNEVEFLGELVRRTGCQLLCDVSNVYLSAHNMGYDAHEYIDGLPADVIAELHLGGFTPEADEANPGAEVFVDTHATVVAEGAWDLYAYALHRFGWKPTLIEWDNDLPPLVTLVREAERADAIAADVLTEPLETCGAVAR